MGIEQIKDFFTVPQMPDIIAFVLLLALFIMQTFIKKFVRKDSLSTLRKVDAKAERLDAVIAELEKERDMYKQERAALEKELAAVKGEFKEIKRIVRMGFCNTESLVKSGVASKIAKLLPIEEEKESAV